MPNNMIRSDYECLLMMRERINGKTFKEISNAFGVSSRYVSKRVNSAASDCMRAAMTYTQGDPEHPATPKFTVEQFTADPRAAMAQIMEERIADIEKRYPAVCSNDAEALKRTVLEFGGEKHVLK